MKHQADKHRQERLFKVGDKVLIKLQPYRQLSVEKRSNHKLAKRYFGPYVVEQVISPVAYRLTLPAGSMIHPVFHVSVLKQFYGPNAVSCEPLPSVIVQNKPVQQPLAILDSREVLVNGVPQQQHLIQWSATVPEDASWEAAADLRKTYPQLHLEDKVTVEGRAVDTVARRGARLKGGPTWVKDFVL
ncbi:uncharacterized protein LOC133312269 [Gastrolobium bilobum]|uniref:uncharacterized protein LOC133312269 n=1 Tax=Gastrolobium bilobum TaxID=150636 RepID=UPI002AB19293|nr:uncharacterized protein LOC133312269 [Gastrolobium bilobum]